MSKIFEISGTDGKTWTVFHEDGKVLWSGSAQLFASAVRETFSAQADRQSANPAQGVSEAVNYLRDAVTVKLPENEITRRAELLVAAIGAGGQAVAVLEKFAALAERQKAYHNAKQHEFPSIEQCVDEDGRFRPDLKLYELLQGESYNGRYSEADWWLCTIREELAAISALSQPQPAERVTDTVDGVAMIAAERRRQIEEEGWTAEHDDAQYHDGELGRAAAAYALSGMKFYQLPVDFVRRRKAIIADIWPWGQEWFKPRGKPDAVIRCLVKAGALIAAEIDQQLRQRAISANGGRQDG